MKKSQTIIERAIENVPGFALQFKRLRSAPEKKRKAPFPLQEMPMLQDRHTAYGGTLRPKGATSLLGEQNQKTTVGTPNGVRGNLCPKTKKQPISCSKAHKAGKEKPKHHQIAGKNAAQVPDFSSSNLQKYKRGNSFPHNLTHSQHHSFNTAFRLGCSSRQNA
ncbi:hypothetical protein IFO69_19750 [Echinicola sp. CAU 1574]|uniref:Uncharacterized protein n=1 Tax=Echinicola arenosa TaxID=2774144 RepID=A0ABR9ARI7_9BACT|nr:hypothetical protein [Echinicola arenosa]MBD8490997.1 hypothetical protein [Echinicola arenosa]